MNIEITTGVDNTRIPSICTHTRVIKAIETAFNKKRQQKDGFITHIFIRLSMVTGQHTRVFATVCTTTDATWEIHGWKIGYNKTAAFIAYRLEI